MDEIIAAIKKYKKFLVTAHVNLEGDSLGSQLAMKEFLAGLGKFPAAVVRFMQRQRWFVILDIAVFFAAMVVLNAVVRSLYFDGNLKDTWRLIVG